jgi:hypothetical protein
MAAIQADVRVSAAGRAFGPEIDPPVSLDFGAAGIAVHPFILQSS